MTPRGPALCGAVEAVAFPSTSFADLYTLKGTVRSHEALAVHGQPPVT
jgi:hypothetical protein